MSASGRRERIAIVGLGPKGLFALERVVHYAAASGAQIHVDAYEPHRAPGAGPVYDPSQPGYLRMNLSADRLDLWTGTNDAIPEPERLSFTAWRRDTDGDAYPPRALVGRYLADGLARILRGLPGGMSVRVLPVEAVRARSCGRMMWSLTGSDGRVRCYAHLLLALGHGTGGAWPAYGSWSHAAPLVPRVFPVERWLSPDAVAPGARVAARGFALTLIDAALALTEGRGGGFGPGPLPHLFRYVPSRADAAAVLPFARTGRPVLAKAAPEIAGVRPGVLEALVHGQHRLAELPEAFGLRSHVVPILARTVEGCLRAARARTGGGEPPTSAQTVAVNLAALCDGCERPAADPAIAMREALDVAVARREPGFTWALAETWQGLYPALVARLDGGSLPTRDWPAFRRLSAELERVAFGPPPVNAAKLLALVEAGRVDLAHVRGGRLSSTDGVTALESGAGAAVVDVVVDTVSTPPGGLGTGSALVDRLRQEGHLRIARGRRGIEVTADAACVRQDGTLSPGLAAIGRVTEDWIVGNDTLNRRLHVHCDRWARTVVATAAAVP